MLIIALATAYAAEPVIQVMSAITYPMGISVPAPLPPSIAHGLNVSVPLDHGWSCTGELDLATGLTSFQPGVQVLMGPTKKLGTNFALGLTALYKFTPSYDDATVATHIAGLSLVPIIPLSFGSMSFPTGVAYNATSASTVIVFNIKIGIRLP